jgi:hypothetical protein
MKDSRNSGFTFIALAAAFFAIGMTTQRAFIAVAVVFLAIGISQIVRSRRTSNK